MGLKEIEKLELTIGEAWSVVTDEHPDLLVVETTTSGHWRHGEIMRTVFQRKTDGRFFKLDWNDSVKDMTFPDMNYPPMIATEVFPQTITTTIYK